MERRTGTLRRGRRTTGGVLTAATVALLSAVSPAQAVPPGTVDQEITAGSTCQFVDGARFHGQGFTPGVGGTLEGLELALGRNAAVTQALTLAVYRTAGSPSETPADSVAPIASATIQAADVAALAFGQSTLVTADFDTPPLVARNRGYAVILTAAGTSSPTSFHWCGGSSSPSGPYAANQSYQRLVTPGSSWSVSPTIDLGLRSYMTASGDVTAPTTTDDVPSTPVQSAPRATLTATDAAGGTGILDTRYQLTGGSACTGTIPSVTLNGLYDPANKPSVPNGACLIYASTDRVGNTEALKRTALVTVDNTPPAAPNGLFFTPASPSSDAAPRLRGGAEAGSTIRVYVGDGCPTGPPAALAASGTQAAFSSPGLTVSVPTDATTSYGVTATDAVGNRSACTAISYTHDGTPPPAPTGLTTDPASPAADRTPSLSGTAEAGSTVRVYFSTDCSGPVETSATAADFAGGTAVMVPADTTTDLSTTATDAAGNTSPCSLAVAYRHVTPPAPEPTPAPTPETTPVPGPPAAPSPAADPPVIPGPTVDPPAIAPQAAAPALCNRSVTLLDVLPAGSRRVRLSGIARVAFAGQRVTLRDGSRRVGIATIAPDGRFAATVRAPTATRRPKVSYTATLASGARSAAYRLERLFTIIRRRTTSRGLVITAKLNAKARGNRVQVQQQTTCKTRRTISSPRVSRTGRVTLTLPSPVGTADPVAIYRVRANVGRGTTFTLQFAVERRG